MEIKVKYTPHFFQKKFHDWASLDNKEVFCITIVAGRQSGKSFALQNQLLKYALENKKYKIWVVSPSDNQSNKFYKDLLKILKNSNLILGNAGSKGNIYIKFLNETEIQFKSALSEDNLRGDTLDILAIDEAADIKESTIQEILLPMLNIRGKKLILAGTPKGKNHLFNYYLQGQDSSQNFYKSLKFTSKDNPRANLKLIKDFKNRLPDAVFRQEFLAEWVDNGAVFNNIYEICHLKNIEEPGKSKYYYAGIDVGIQNDYTVASIFNNNGELVNYQRYRAIESSQIRNKLEKFLKQYNPRKVLIETNNQGLVFYHDLKDKIDNLETFTTSNKSKEEIISELISAFNRKEIHLLDDKDIINEFEAFIFKFTKTGKITFEAAHGHDDIVMSIALAWKAFKDFKIDDINIKMLWC